jgi:hypothetical protein
MTTRAVMAFFLLFLLFLPMSAFARKKHRRHKPEPEKKYPELDARLAKFKRVPMPYVPDGLTERQQMMVDKLIEACHYLEDIYWRQSDPDGLALLESLRHKTDPESARIRRLLIINGSRFDLTDNNAPFTGTEPYSPDRGLFPKGLTREDIEAYVKLHPDKADTIYSPYAIVRRNGDDLEGVPYHIAYKDFLQPAAKALHLAADLSDDADFAKFLNTRADALMSDDYYPSDLLWVDLKNPKIDVIFAPYETYLDDVLGVKTSYGAAVLIRNEAESKKLELFQKYVPDIQDALPLAPEDRPSKHGQPTPMEVMDAPYRAGDLRHGYQAVADNLPNDPRIHEQKGTKKIFFKNFMDARVNVIILPLAQRLMRPDQAALASADGYLTDTIMHEISHGLGPAFSRTAGGQADIRKSIGPTFSGLEEAKADVVGMYGLQWLVDHGALPKDKLPTYYASYVAGIFRTVRFGVAEAHGRAEMMEFNYLSEQGAIQRERVKTPQGMQMRYVVVMDKISGAIASLAKELLEQEATGDRARAEKWFQKYDSMPPELQSALSETKDVPVDIDPVFSFPEPIQ